MSSHSGWEYCARRFILKTACKTREFEDSLKTEYRQVNNRKTTKRRKDQYLVQSSLLTTVRCPPTFFEALSLNNEYSTCGVWRGSKTTQSVLRWRWCLSFSKLHKHLAAVRGQHTYKQYFTSHMTSEVSRTSKSAKLLIFPRGWYFLTVYSHISLKVWNRVHEYGYWTHCVYLERNILSLECNRTGWRLSKPFLMQYSAICRG